MLTNKTQKNPTPFLCEICDFKCFNKKDFNRHLLTLKHKMLTNVDAKTQKNANPYTCECGKEYKHRQSLHIHKKKCNYKTEKEMELKGKQDAYNHLFPLMKEMMTELVPVLQPHNTTNNQNFNINIFLNEQCKDAMNITDFIESIQLSIEDMTKLGTEGQTKGMSNILIDKLNSLDIVKRPMHCSDIKKETIYIKDQDKWEKEDSNKPKLIDALDKLSVKSIKSLDTIEDDPELYVQTASEILKEPRENKKIISSLAKEISLEN